MSNHGHAPHCSGCSCTPHLAVASHNRQPSPPRSPLERPHRIQMHCRVNKAHATTQHSVRPGSTQRAHGSDSGLTEHGLQLHGHRFVHPHHRRHVVIAHSLHPQRPQASQESAATPFFAFLRHQAIPGDGCRGSTPANQHRSAVATSCAAIGCSTTRQRRGTKPRACPPSQHAL